MRSGVRKAGYPAFRTPRNAGTWLSAPFRRAETGLGTDLLPPDIAAEAVALQHFPDLMGLLGIGQ